MGVGLFVNKPTSRSKKKLCSSSSGSLTCDVVVVVGGCGGGVILAGRLNLIYFVKYMLKFFSFTNWFSFGVYNGSSTTGLPLSLSLSLLVIGFAFVTSATKCNRTEAKIPNFFQEEMNERERGSTNFSLGASL